MKKLLYLTISIFGLCSMVCAQQQSMKKPKIMVVPEEAFCINAGMFKLNHQGDKIADYKKAMQYFLKAAECGDEYGEAYLGLFYEKGYSIEKNYLAAFGWYYKAALKGNAF